MHSHHDLHHCTLIKAHLKNISMFYVPQQTLHHFTSKWEAPINKKLHHSYISVKAMATVQPTGVVIQHVLVADDA